MSNPLVRVRSFHDTNRGVYDRIASSILRPGRLPERHLELIGSVSQELNMPLGNVLMAAGSLQKIGVIDITKEGLNEDRTSLTDQAGRITLGTQYLSGFVSASDIDMTYAAQIIQKSLIRMKAAQDGYPFHFSIFRYMNGGEGGLSLLSTNVDYDPMQSIYKRSMPIKPRGLFKHLIETNAKAISEFDFNDPDEFLSKDEEMISLFTENTEGPGRFLLLPMRSRDQLIGFTMVHRQMQNAEKPALLYYPASLIQNPDQVERVYSEVYNWGKMASQLILNAAGRESVPAKTYDNSFFSLSLQRSNVVKYEGFPVEVIHAPGSVEGNVKDLMKQEIGDLARSVLHEYTDDFVQKHLSGSILLSVRREGHQIAYAAGSKIDSQGGIDVPILYHSATVVDKPWQKNRGMGLHIYLSGLMARSAVSTPFYYVFRSAAPEFWDQVNDFSKRTFPNIADWATVLKSEFAGRCDDVDGLWSYLLGSRYIIPVSGEADKAQINIEMVLPDVDGAVRGFPAMLEMMASPFAGATPLVKEVFALSLKKDVLEQGSEEFMKVAGLTAKNIGSTLNGYVSQNTYPVGTDLKISGGDPKTRLYYEYRLSKWDDGSPKDAMMVVSYLDAESKINLFDGNMNVRLLAELRKRKKSNIDR